jgi:hypothetical protein
MKMSLQAGSAAEAKAAAIPRLFRMIYLKRSSAPTKKGKNQQIIDGCYGNALLFRNRFFTLGGSS